jgi:hypothetical protein
MIRDCPKLPSVEDDNDGTVCATFNALCLPMSDTRLVPNGNEQMLNGNSCPNLVSDIESDNLDIDVNANSTADTSISEEISLDANHVSVSLPPVHNVYVGQEEKEPHGMALATLKKLAWNEVLLDNQADRKPEWFL